jgi:hypothetical protein
MNAIGIIGSWLIWILYCNFFIFLRIWREKDDWKKANNLGLLAFLNIILTKWFAYMILPSLL